MKKQFLTANLLLITAVLFGDLYYHFIGTTLVKGIVSSGFVLLAITNLIYSIKLKSPNLKFPILMTFGAVLGMLGDILLASQFVFGAASFAISHVFFAISYSTLIRFRLRNLIPAVCVFLPPLLFMTLAPFFDYGSLFMEMLCITYAAVICIMVGKAISNFIEHKKLSYGIILVGSILFYISDFMLLLYVFGGAPEITDILCIATYYPAQCLLAHSLYHVATPKAAQVSAFLSQESTAIQTNITTQKIS